jgi:hypothetical protein
MNNRIRSAIYLFIVLLLPLVIVSCVNGSSSIPSAESPVVPTPTDGGSIGTRTKTTGCVAQNALPDPACTPGAIFPEATKDKICVPGYSSEVRNVPQSEKNQAYEEYGIQTHTTGQYEVDHLISLELGGSNDIANLWPEAAEPRPGFHEKDKVENYLHKQVCDGSMSLQDAQYQIAHDWMAVYQNMQGK